MLKVATKAKGLKAEVFYYWPYPKLDLFYFYIPWKRQKTKGFQTFSGGTEMEHV